MNLDLTPVWQLLDPAIPAAVTVLGGYVAYAIGKFLHIANNSTAQDDLDQALEHGSALAVDWYKSVENHNASVKVPEDKLDEIVAHVLSLAPTAETVLGVTPATVGQIIQSKLTQWLHWTNVAATNLTPASAQSAPAAEPETTKPATAS